jgi:hypothetical protein
MNRWWLPFLSTALIVVLSNACSGDDGAKTDTDGEPTQVNTPIPTALGLTSTDLESLPSTVLRAAPGYAQKESTAEQLSAARETFAAQLADGLEGFDLLRFLNPDVNIDHPQAPNGTLLVECGTVSNDQAPQLLPFMEGMRETGLTDFGPELQERYNAGSIEEIDEAADLGDRGWGLKVMIDGSDMFSVADSSVEFPDLPFTMLMFVRENALVKISAYYDSGLDPLAVARAVDTALVKAVREAPVDATNGQ